MRDISGYLFLLCQTHLELLGGGVLLAAHEVVPLGVVPLDTVAPVVELDGQEAEEESEEDVGEEDVALVEVVEVLGGRRLREEQGEAGRHEGNPS